jgi:hypothetical protein
VTRSLIDRYYFERLIEKSSYVSPHALRRQRGLVERIESSIAAFASDLPMSQG